MAACPVFDPLGPLVSSLVSYVDCQGLAFGEAGYKSLGPGSTFGMVFTGLLTIYVALIGYRLLLGGGLSVRSTVWAAARLGLVLALATQWQAYRVLVFDVATQGPEAVATLSASSAAGQTGTQSLATRFDQISSALLETSRSFASQVKTPPQPTPVAAPAAAETRGVADLEWRRSMVTITALVGLLSVRILMAFLLASGPCFILCALFESTIGLWIGWLRVLAGTFFGALAMPVFLNLELAVVERQVSALQTMVSSNQLTSTISNHLLLASSFFALVMIALFVAAARIGLAIQLPRRTEASSAAGLANSASANTSWAGIGAFTRDGTANFEAAGNRAQNIVRAPQFVDVQAQRLSDQTFGDRTARPRENLVPGIQEPFRATQLGQQGRRSRPRRTSAAQLRDDLK